MSTGVTKRRRRSTGRSRPPAESKKSRSLTSPAWPIGKGSKRLLLSSATARGARRAGRRRRTSSRPGPGCCRGWPPGSGPARPRPVIGTPGTDWGLAPAPGDRRGGPLDPGGIGADQDVARIRDAVGHVVRLPAAGAGPGAEDEVVVAVGRPGGIGQRRARTSSGWAGAACRPGGCGAASGGRRSRRCPPGCCSCKGAMPMPARLNGSASTAGPWLAFWRA